MTDAFDIVLESIKEKIGYVDEAPKCKDCYFCNPMRQPGDCEDRPIMRCERNPDWPFDVKKDGSCTKWEEKKL